MASPSDPATPQFPGVGSSVASTARIPIYADGDPKQRRISLTDLRTEMKQVSPAIDSISQTMLYDDLTDVTTTGTLAMTEYLPVGAIVIGTKCLVEAGFAGDTSATLTVGDTDVDRFMTGTPSVFTTAATGIQTGIPSGTKLIVTAVQPICIVTTAANYTAVDAGSFTITVYFIRTVAA
jgi:hypothetical protein